MRSSSIKKGSEQTAKRRIKPAAIQSGGAAGPAGASGVAHTHPCASDSPRRRLVELLWSFAPAFQRWSESLMSEKKLSPQRLRILASLHERGPRIMCDLKE